MIVHKEAAKAALRVLTQRGIIHTWDDESVEAMCAALKAAKSA